MRCSTLQDGVAFIGEDAAAARRWSKFGPDGRPRCCCCFSNVEQDNDNDDKDLLANEFRAVWRRVRWTCRAHREQWMDVCADDDDLQARTLTLFGSYRIRTLTANFQRRQLSRRRRRRQRRRGTEVDDFKLSKCACFLCSLCDVDDLCLTAAVHHPPSKFEMLSRTRSLLKPTAD